jgi:hypothetical protein
MPSKTRGRKTKDQTIKFANGSLQTVFEVDPAPSVQQGEYDDDTLFVDQLTVSQPMQTLLSL